MSVASPTAGQSPVAGPATAPAQRPPRRSALNRAWLPGLIAGVLAVAEIAARVVVKLHGQISGLALVGNVYGHPGHVPSGTEVFSYPGYDGQFYYRMALAPASFQRTMYGISIDSTYRFVRIGYSALAWLASAGQHAAVPWALAVINVLSLAAIATLGGLFAQEAGRPALWGLLLAGYFGLATGVARDLTEPLAAALLLAGLLAYRRRRPLLAAGVFAFAALTRETAVIAPVALGITRLIGIARRRTRPGRADLAWVVPGVAFVAWEAVLKRVTGEFPIVQDGGKNAGAPFVAAFQSIGHNFSHLTTSVHGAPGAVVIWDLEFLVLMLFAVAALGTLGQSSVPGYERLALVLYVLEIFSLSPTNWDGYADLRSFVEVFLLATLVLFAAPRRLVWFAAAAAPMFLTVAVYRTLVL
ncbi:MAG TPA: hypothetical protein VHW06_02640 [Streptosporangiaceae bacterium]|jgi:hypothetical protein|nr:hypothetical protein [Streptosporangiaceae bacterium]